MLPSGQLSTTVKMYASLLKVSYVHDALLTHSNPMQGFYTLYRNLFGRLAQEEAVISEIEYPSFGYSTWPWAAEAKADNTEAARRFYNAWLNFSSMKDFTWMEQWNTAEAPDRRVRR